MKKINSLDKTSISIRAKDKWNSKSEDSRLRASNKYKFLFEKFKKPAHDWSDTFDHLNKFQRNILIKGELIRTYDSLPNTEKTKIMRELELSKFSSKWYRLEPEDKKKLLNYVIDQ